MVGLVKIENQSSMIICSSQKKEKSLYRRILAFWIQIGSFENPVVWVLDIVIPEFWGWSKGCSEVGG